jgi:hypothetical protein
MKLLVRVKQVGRKKALFQEKDIEIKDPGTSPSLRELIAAVVAQQVESYNSKTAEENILPFLTEREIDESSASGKVGFESIYNSNKADVARSIENAHQSFEDGIFAVFIGDEQINHLDEKINLDDSPVITFIRLTFLSGSIW